MDSNALAGRLDGFAARSSGNPQTANGGGSKNTRFGGLTRPPDRPHNRRVPKNLAP